MSVSDGNADSKEFRDRAFQVKNPSGQPLKYFYSLTDDMDSYRASKFKLMVQLQRNRDKLINGNNGTK